MNRARHLLKSSVFVILFLGLGKITGLIRVRLVSTAFGTGPEYDAFTAANQLPEVFFIVIAGGSLAAAFIPVYSAYLSSDSKVSSSAQLANSVLTLVIMLLGSISAVGALLAPWLTRVVLVPDFSPQMQHLTADLMRIILIQTTIFGVSGVISSILNAHQHFALPALAPIALDIGYVVGLYLLSPRLGINGLAWGTVIGGLLHIAIQLPALISNKIRIRLCFRFRQAGIAEVARLMGPRIVTLGAIQAADLIVIRLTSSLPVGSTSSYFYGYALMQLPETLFGTAIALVIFPTMAELFNAGNIEGLRRSIFNALKIIWTLTIPAAAGLVLLGRPLIGIMLQGGAFDADSSRLVYSVLIVFSIRVVSESTLEIVARLFYAQHNTRTPMFAYLGWLFVNVTLAYALVRPFGIVGLAAASTVAFTLLAAALYLLNRRVLGSFNESELALTAARAGAASVAMAAVIWLVNQAVASDLLRLAAGGGLGIATYFLASFLLGGREIQSLVKLIRA